MRNITHKRLLIIFFLLSFSLVNAQELSLSKYKSFIQKNFPEFLEYFHVQDLASFKTDNINLGTSVIDTRSKSVTTRRYSSEEWESFLKTYDLFFNQNRNYLNILISEYQPIKLPYSLGSLGTQGEYAEAMWINKRTFIVAGVIILTMKISIMG